jgi:hypothetical protein
MFDKYKDLISEKLQNNLSEFNKVNALFIDYGIGDPIRGDLFIIPDSNNSEPTITMGMIGIEKSIVLYENKVQCINALKEKYGVGDPVRGDLPIVPNISFFVI